MSAGYCIGQVELVISQFNFQTFYKERYRTREQKDKDNRYIEERIKIKEIKQRQDLRVLIHAWEKRQERQETIYKRDKRDIHVRYKRERRELCMREEDEILRK